MEVLCNVDLVNSIEFTYEPKCLQIAVNENIKLSCISNLHASNNVSIQIRSFMHLKYRDINSERLEKCETFLIFVSSSDDLKEIFELDWGHSQLQFFPFTKIYFYNYEHHRWYDDTACVDDYMTQLKNHLISNALFGYVSEHTNDKIVVRDLLTNEEKRSISSYKPSDLLHPIVNTHSTNDNFTISLFNCKPFIFYPKDVSDNEIIEQIDGTEFRFINEVTKNWKKTYKFRDFSRTKVSPYNQVMQDLLNKTSDLAMCSVWILGKHYKTFDFTTFYEQHYITFLVPKPRKRNEATAIYTALHPLVRWLLLLSFVLSCVLLNCISKMEKRMYQRSSQYTEFTRVVMDTIGAFTSHSVYRFPGQNGHVTAKILLTSWIWLSLGMGIIYTTIYTSRLTSPGYEKPINTIRQFLDHDLHMCSTYISTDIVDILVNSINVDYRQLSNRSLIFDDNRLHQERLFVERICGIAASRATNNYISVAYEPEDIDLISTLRLMQDNLFSQYTGFALQKHSPYTKLFDWYQEHGIIQSWYLGFAREQQRLVRILSDYPKHDSARQINLVNVSGAFLLFCSGSFLSVVIFFVEIITKHYSF